MLITCSDSFVFTHSAIGHENTFQFRLFISELIIDASLWHCTGIPHDVFALRLHSFEHCSHTFILKFTYSLCQVVFWKKWKLQRIVVFSEHLVLKQINHLIYLKISVSFQGHFLFLNSKHPDLKSKESNYWSWTGQQLNLDQVSNSIKFNWKGREDQWLNMSR